MDLSEGCTSLIPVKNVAQNVGLYGGELLSIQNAVYQPLCLHADLPAGLGQPTVIDAFISDSPPDCLRQNCFALWFL